MALKILLGQAPLGGCRGGWKRTHRPSGPGCHQCSGPLGRLVRRVAGYAFCGPRCEGAFYRDEEPIEPVPLVTAGDLDIQACVADVGDLRACMEHPRS